MMGVYKRIVGTVAVLALAGMGALAAEGDKGPIKIGCIFAITGPASWLGEPEAKTVEMIAEQVNAAGGIGGRQIQLLVEDSQGDETRTVNAAKSLIRQDVLAIIGPSRSGTTLAINKLCDQQKVPLISCAAASTITAPGLKWVFKTPHKDSHAVERIYDYMKAHGMKKIAIITGTTGFGAAGRAQLKKIAEGYGIEIAADETYGPKDTDMTAQLTRIRGAGVDAIVNWSIVPAQSIVMKNMKQLGMKMQLFQSHGFGNLKYVQIAGDAANGVIFPAARLLAVDELQYGHPHRAMLAEYKRLYEEKNETAVSSFGGHANDALWLVLEAVENGANTRAEIRDAIENRKNFLGTAGLFNFSADDHTGLTKDSFEMLTVKDGKFTVAPK